MDFFPYTFQVHHGGAGTTAAGLKAAVLSLPPSFSSLVTPNFPQYSVCSLLLMMFITSNLQCPTTIIPFFGDQFFWGSMVHARGLGAPPVPVEQLQLHSLVDAIKFMIDPKVNVVKLMWYLQTRDYSMP